MKRDIVKINRELCDGCGLCIPNCHEGALQIIDGKATLISDLMCDGLGACIGHCPQDAITIEKREAEAYNEQKVMEEMIKQGENVVIAHLKHLKEHNEIDFLNQGIKVLELHKEKLDFNLEDVKSKLFNDKNMKKENHECGCPGGKTMDFTHTNELKVNNTAVNQPSELRQWPVQMHLINPNASYFQKADLVLAADCVAFSLGNFHCEHLKGKSLAIACPKLDSGSDIYIQKLVNLIEDAQVNTINVMMMEVPCCGGLLQMVKTAQEQAIRKVPVKQTIVGLQGEIIKEEWI